MCGAWSSPMDGAHNVAEACVWLREGRRKAAVMCPESYVIEVPTQIPDPDVHHDHDHACQHATTAARLMHV